MFSTIGRCIAISFKMFTLGLDAREPSGLVRTATLSATRRTSSERVQDCFTGLGSDNFLAGLSNEDFARKAATFLATLNAIHMFRDGNGRAQLAFMALLADAAGHPLHLDRLEPEMFLRAMIRSFHGDEGVLAEQLARLL
jgi:fido (protein-threonine AMPylation protein)